MFKQPAKRKIAATESSGGGANKAAAAAPRPSKLAKEHDITAQEEAEIREAFALFSEPMEGEKEGVIPTSDVRRAMMYVSPFLLPLVVPSLVNNTKNISIPTHGVFAGLATQPQVLACAGPLFD